MTAALTPESNLSGTDLDAWADFSRDMRFEGLSPNTLRSYGTAVAQLARWQRDRGQVVQPVLSATKADLTGFLTWVRAEHRGRCLRSAAARQACTGHVGTQETRYLALRRFYGWLAAEDIITENPAARISPPRGQRKVVRSVTDDQITALLKACEGKDFKALRDTAIIRLWLEIGSPRVSEVAALLDGDVDLRADVILLHGKGAKQRRIALSPETARAFSRYRRARARHHAAASARFFLGLHGPLTRSGTADILRVRGQQAGIGHVHPHMFRHAASVAGRRAGLPDTVIAVLNGWSSTRMMERYGADAAAELALDMARTAGLGGRLTKTAR